MHRKSLAARTAALTLVASAALTGLVGCAKGSTDADAGVGADKGEYTIALSNSFIGNPWRQTMVKVFENAAAAAKADGLIADYSVNNTAQNTATEQIAQIKSLILKKPSAILINSASPTALNPVIKQACDAGIVVITFDSVASEPCSYTLQADLAKFGAEGAAGVIDAMGGKGNVIVVRGVVGSAPEKVIYDAQMAEIAKNPGITVVSELQGEASNSVTQQAVQSALPSLPDIQGVITGGSTYGALQAFQSADRALPFGNFSNDGSELAFWQQLKAEDPSFSSASVRPDPGQSVFALYQALEILDGKKVPQGLIMPNLQISDDTLDDWIAVTPESATAAWQWTQEETRAGIKAQTDKKDMPTPGIPTTAP